MKTYRFVFVLALGSCGGEGEAHVPESGEVEGAVGALEGHGSFVGEVIARWLDEDRTMELIEDFAYEDEDGHRWEAPKGSVVDGASIPSALWSVVGAPFTGSYRKASVVHDVACQVKNNTWQDVHDMFYVACRCGGVGRIKSKVMYWAVYHLGPRWEPGGAFRPALTSLSAEQQVRFDEMVEFIESSDPSLEDLQSLSFE